MSQVVGIETRKSISIVIPAFDAAGSLRDCLEAIAAQSRKPDEVIVADNGSTDATPAIAREFAAAHPDLALRVVSAEKRGPGPARNAGSKEARGEIFAFTDADCVPSSDWLAKLVAPIESGIAVATAGGVRAHAPATRVEQFQALLLPAPPPDGTATRLLGPFEAGMTGSLAVRRDTFLAAGGFDERLRWLEDTAFSNAIRRTGGSIAAAPDAFVRHRFPSTLAGLARRAWKYGSCSAEFFRIEYPRRILVEMTRHLRIDSAALPVRVWIVVSPDKVLALAMLPGLAWPPLWALAFPPLLYYYVDVLRRSRSRGMPLGLAQCAGVLAVDLLYHAILTLGRFRGSLRGRTLCL
jgi:glycosyltransferase involved in cell wall biosynthesis